MLPIFMWHCQMLTPLLRDFCVFLLLIAEVKRCIIDFFFIVLRLDIESRYQLMHIPFQNMLISGCRWLIGLFLVFRYKSGFKKLKIEIGNLSKETTTRPKRRTQPEAKSFTFHHPCAFLELTILYEFCL